MRYLEYVFRFFLCFGLFGCGVKGDPLPPLDSAPIGRGKPTFKRAFEKKRKKAYTDLHEIEDESEEEGDDDGDE